MTVDYFLLEGSRAIPQEFDAWRTAYKLATDAFLALPYGAPKEQEDAVAALVRKADALEETARAAFLLWLMRRK